MANSKCIMGILCSEPVKKKSCFLIIIKSLIINALFVTLSNQDDRSLINLHLMHTSYFLFVMVITMFCYAVIKGRPGKVRQTNPDFCPEKVQQTPAVLYDVNR